MAKLPSTIYAKLEKQQRTLFNEGYAPSLAMGDIYAIFSDCGYKITTANKWLLNWAVCMRAKFEIDKDGHYRVRFGFFEGSPQDMLCGGRVWLPVKEVALKNDVGNRAQKVLL